MMENGYSIKLKFLLSFIEELEDDHNFRFLQHVRDEVWLSEFDFDLLINGQQKPSYNSPLHLAAARGYVVACRRLVEVGGDVRSLNGESVEPFGVVVDESVKEELRQDLGYQPTQETKTTETTTSQEQDDGGFTVDCGGDDEDWEEFVERSMRSWNTSTQIQTTKRTTT